MKHKMLRILLLSAICLAILPVSAFAIGWSYNIPPLDHWGSSPATTAYPYLNFTVTPTKAGEHTVYIQKLSNGSWVNVTPGIYVYSNKKILSIKPSSSSTQYRVYITTGLHDSVAGTVSYSGTRTPQGTLY